MQSEILCTFENYLKVNWFLWKTISCALRRSKQNTSDDRICVQINQIEYGVHTSGTGQHPCAPWGSSQQVVLSGHDAFPSGHLTLNTFFFSEIAGNLENHGMEVTPCKQVPV